MELGSGFKHLYTSPPLGFSGYATNFDEARYVIFGVPFDGTSSYRPGSRFAPMAIREASLNIETYSFRTGLDIEDLRLSDLGDLHIADLDETLRRAGSVVKEISALGKVPLAMGGEHTISFATSRALGKPLKIVSFDAHMDLRDDYLGVRLCHATFNRRLCEELGNEALIEVGIRAVCKEELDYAKKKGIRFITSRQIMEEPKEAFKDLEESLEGAGRIYVTVDMDVLDPAFAPGVGNPEPEGLPTSILLDLLKIVCDERCLGFDIVEVTPLYDRGETAIQAAKIIFEALCYLESHRK
ncbi:agmatinase [Candidatus Bathyarchaeota archaeon]|nr:agmatinase [Candidatus Bathyarchaeota archaeon]